MTQRTTLALLFVAIALFAFIVLYERKTLTTTELEGRETRLVERFVRARIDRITLEGSHGTIEVARDPRPNGEMGPWRIVRPLNAPADEEAVDSFLSTLEWTEPTRTLENPTREDLRAFGLDAPRLRVRLRMLGETTLLAVGRDDPSGDGVYAQVVGSPEAHVVGKDVREALDVDVAHFRDKRLFVDSLEDVEVLELTTSTGTARMKRTGEAWSLASPDRMLASSERIAAALGAMREVRATRFVEDAPRDLARYGLAQPLPRAKAGSVAEPSKHVLGLGRPCEGHPGERYARAGDGPVVCVSNEATSALDSEAAAYRELRLLPLENADVTRLEIRDPSGSLTVESGDQGYRHVVVRSGSEIASGPTDEAALADFLDALRGARASAVRALAGDEATLPGRLTVRRADGGSYEVSFGEPGDDGFVVRRSGEAVALVFPSASRSLLSPSALHFRSPRWLSARAEQLSELVVERGGARETVVRGTDGPRVTAPVSLAADSGRFLDAAARLAALEAVRFVAEGKRPEHGLDTPRLVVTYRLGSPEDDGHGHASSAPASTHVLRIGMPTEGGAFATFDADPAVFVVSQALVDLVATPFADRDVFATDAIFVDSLILAVDGRTTTVRRDGTRFATEAGPADESRTVDLTSALADLRADEVVSYGRPTAASGLSRPRARITVGRAEEAAEPRRYTILVGATEGEGDRASTYVAREGLPVTYRVASGRLARILDYRP